MFNLFKKKKKNKGGFSILDTMGIMLVIISMLVCIYLLFFKK